MAKKVISRGTVANDGTGDNLRDGAGKINDNFDEIYTAIGDGSTVDGTIKIADDSSTVTTLSANGETLRVLGGTAITSTISGNTLTIAADTSSLITADGTATLTNKTINGPDNTITNIANSSLSNSSITLRDASSTTDTLSLGDTFNILGTTNEIETAVTNNTVTIGLPNNVTIGNNLTVTGNLTVSGTTTTVDSTTVSIQNAFVFEGATADDFETTLTTIDPTADRTISLPNATGTIVLQDTTDTLTNKTIAAGSNTISGLTNSNLSGSAAISNANLANSSFTLGDDSISLGGTQTSVANLSLTGSTGTINLTSSDNRVPAVYANTGSFPTASTYEGMFAYDTGGDNPYVADSGGWVKILTENGSIADLSNVGTLSGIADEEILVFRSSTGRFDPKPQKINAAVEIDVTNNGSGAYEFNSHYSGNNPTIYVRAGATYAFNLDVSGHPFHLQTVSGAYSSGNSYTTGLTHHAADGTVTTGSNALLKESGTLYYEVPSGTTGTIYYACQYHSSMAGSIVIQNDQSTAGNFAYSTDKLTGDGSTTAFTIDSGRTVDDILVFVDGICFVPTDDYTISSTTLTFTVAPVASAEITIRYLPLN